jgi:hypothetical protein
MEEIINLNKQTAGMDNRVLLSTLWLFAMLNYTYGDVVTLMDSSMLKQYLNGNVGGLQLSQGFLLGASIFQEIPIAMILLSRLLGYKQNRWSNIIAGTIMTVALVPTLFVGMPTMHYIFFSVLEIICTAFIVIFAWGWKE